MVKTDTLDKLIYFYLILIVTIIVAIFIFFYYIVLHIAPNILNNELPNLPINYNDIYPILLQGLIIISGIILGLFGTLFFETIKRLKSSTEKYEISLKSKTLLYLVILVLGLTIILFALFSIFYSINAMINYGIVSTYVTTQINANIINTISPSGNVVLINASYINSNIASNVVKPKYELLLTNSRLAITYLFDGFELLVIFIAIYVLFIFELIGQVKKFIEAGLANSIGIALITISLLFFLLFFFYAQNLELCLGIFFVISAGVVLLFREGLNQYLDKLDNKRKNKRKRRAKH